VIRLLACALAALAVAGAAAARPEPPPVWQTRTTHQPLRAGATATFTYRVTSADTFTLDVSLRPLPSRLLLVGTRRSWKLVFPGDAMVTRSVVLRVRIRLKTPVGTRLCVTLRQTAASTGGVPIVAPVSSCARVLAPNP
jgi:hypothetical protein